MDEALTDEIRRATKGSYVLGGKKVQAQIGKALGKQVTRGQAGRPAEKADGKAQRQGLLL